MGDSSAGASLQLQGSKFRPLDKKHSHVEAGQQMHEANCFWSLHNDAASRSRMNKRGRGEDGDEFFHISLHKRPTCGSKWGNPGPQTPAVTSDLRGRLSKLVSGYIFHRAPLIQRATTQLYSRFTKYSDPLQFTLCYGPAICTKINQFRIFFLVQAHSTQCSRTPSVDLLQNKH